MRAQIVKAGLIAEKTADMDQHLLIQVMLLPLAALQVFEIALTVLDIQQVHPPDDPPLERSMLIMIEIDTGTAHNDIKDLEKDALCFLVTFLYRMHGEYGWLTKILPFIIAKTLSGVVFKIFVFPA
jgi:hypothetical protein